MFGLRSTPTRPSLTHSSTILNYALTLEHLEAEFYKEGLAKFTAADFAAAGFKDKMFYPDLQRVASDEATHVAALTAALQAAKQPAAAACTYNFGITTPQSFVNLASVLEGVGVSAYLGAAASITSKEYLTVAGSILTVEARHNAWIRSEKGQYPFPQAFDTPLDFDEVYTLAAAFITSCPPNNPKLPVMAFPALAPTQSTIYKAGSTITFTVKDTSKLPSNLYVAWPVVTGPIFVPATCSGGKVTSKVPMAGIAGPAGQTYAILTTSNSTLTDKNTVAGPAIVNVQVQ